MPQRERASERYETVIMPSLHKKCSDVIQLCVSVRLSKFLCLSTCESTSACVCVRVCVDLGSDGLPEENGCHYSLRMKHEKRKTKQEPEQQAKADMISACQCVCERERKKSVRSRTEQCSHNHTSGNVQRSVCPVLHAESELPHHSHSSLSTRMFSALFFGFFIFFFSDDSLGSLKRRRK